MATDIEVHRRLPDLIEKAAASLASAKTAGEVLEACDQAAFAYSAAKAAAKFARLREAHATVLAKCHQAQADALEIEARAQCRLADEYEAAQERGEIANHGRSELRGSRDNLQKKEVTPTVADFGLTWQQVYEARQIRDAEKREPGIVRDTLNARLDAGKEPRRADVLRAIGRGKPKDGEPQQHKSRPPGAIQREEKVATLRDRGLTAKEIAAEVGLCVRAVHQALEHDEIRREAEAQIDPSTLSVSAQQKLEAAIRQEKRKLAAQFEQLVLDECRKRIEDTILPSYNKKKAEYDQLIKARKGIMSRATFNKIRSCLHPDSRKSVTDEKLNEAFRLFGQLELVLLNEKENPTETVPWPRTYEELMALKAKASADRKAKRGHHGVTRK